MTIADMIVGCIVVAGFVVVVDCYHPEVSDMTSPDSLNFPVHFQINEKMELFQIIRFIVLNYF